MNLCFVPSVNDVSDKLFLLTVWEDNNGTPGELLYEDDVFNPRTPIYTQGANQYVSYFFTDTSKIPVGTSFFIGWRQLDPERFNLGFDRNIDQSDEIFYSVDGGGSWLVSPFSGSAMLRPLFSTEMDATLGITPPYRNQNEFTVYPNPTKDLVFISLPDNVKGSDKLLLDGLGRVLDTTKDTSFDLSTMLPGIYYISIPSISAQLSKVIKQ